MNYLFIFLIKFIKREGEALLLFTPSDSAIDRWRHRAAQSKLDSLVSDMLGSSHPQQIAIPHDNQSSSNIVVTNDEIVEQTPRIKKIYEVDYHKLSEFF